jgi:general secretion pathway protein I
MKSAYRAHPGHSDAGKSLARVFGHGFTLVEVMVALLIVGLALPALMFQIGSQTASVQSLQARSTAAWVARNQLAETRLLAAAGQWSAPAYSDGETDMAQQRWRWQMRVEQTPLPGFVRVNVLVASVQAPDAMLANLTVFESLLAIPEPAMQAPGNPLLGGQVP